MEGPLIREPHNVFPSSIVGIPSGKVEDVTLENITINYSGGGKKENAFINKDTLDRVPERIKNYPEFSMFGELPAWGLYIRHADGIRIKNMLLTNKGADYRSAFVADDVNGLKLNNLKVPKVTAQPVIIMNKVSNLETKQIQIQGDKNKNIEIR